MRLLLDENLSPITADSLRASGHEVRRVSAKTEGKRLDDEGVSEIARREGRFVLTFDLEFGERFFSCLFIAPGVIVLRPRDQRPERVNEVLAHFFARYTRAEELRDRLFVVTEGRVRIRRKS